MRRVVAAVAAIVLAIVGAVLLTNYVRNADERALAGLESTDVLVVEEVIPEGTTAEAAEASVSLRKLPVSAVAPGALESLEDVAGQVTTAELQPGEVLLAARFADPASVADPTRVDPPEGYQEVTIQLEAQRVLGGTLKAGDRVGVIFSATIADNPNTDDFDETADVTSNVLDQVLVTRVAFTEQAVDENGQRLPQSLYVTFAVTTPEAERIVFGMEHASVWLTLQPEGPLVGTSEIVTPGVILQ